MRRLLKLSARILATVLVMADLSSGYAADDLSDARVMLQKGDLAGAQIVLRNVVRDKPANAEAHYRLASVSLSLGDAVAAEKEARLAKDTGYPLRPATALLIQTLMTQRKFRFVLEQIQPVGQDPVLDAEIYLGRADAHLRLAETTEARAAFGKAVQVSPDSVPGLSGAMQLALLDRDREAVARNVGLILAADPGNVSALALKVQFLRESGKADEALVLLDKAVADHPDRANMRLQRAQLLISLNRDDAALKDITLVLSMTPRSIQAILTQAYLQVRAKDYKRADATLQKMSAEIGNVPRGLYLLAVVKQNLGQLQQAVEAAEKYHTRLPGDPAGAKLLGRLQLERRRPDLAAEALVGLADANVQDAELYNLLGRAYSLTGKDELAMQAFQKATALVPDSSANRFRLARAHMAIGQVEEAASDLEQSLQLAPSSVGVGAALFYASLATGDLAKAENALKQVRAAQGDTAAVLNLEGVLKLARLDYDGARAAFDRALAMQPGFAAAQVNIARVDLMQGRDAEAGELLQDVLKREPASEPALGMQVGRSIRQNDSAAAIKILEQAVAAKPGNLHVRLLLADVYERNKELSKAIAVLTPEPGLPPTAASLAALGRLQWAKGEFNPARDSYTRALDIDPAALDIRLQFAGLLSGRREFNTAHSVIEAGLRVDPRNYAIMEALLRTDVEAFGQGFALATADRLRRGVTDFPFARALRGDVYFLAGQYGGAIEEYSREINAGPFGFLQQRLARVYLALKNPGLALQTMRDWVQQAPTDMQSARMLAWLELSAGNLPEAEAAFQTILQAVPRDGVILNELALIYQKQGDQRARETAEKAYLFMPTSQTADTLGWILLEQGSTGAAIPLLYQATVSQPGNPALLYHYAAALARDGRKADARQVLEPLAAADRSFPERPDALKLLDAVRP